ncbi:MAG: OmpH family outer membrane protein [Armatimonadota bacterium]|nr:OmpH family outer membrane protein [Armatimonadota bacterium]
MKFNKKQYVMVFAAFLLGMFALTAWEQNTLKLAAVNLGDVAERSKLGQREKKEFETLRTKYGSLIQFLNTNKSIAREDAQKMVDLWNKEKPTPAETQQLEGLKTKGQTQSEELRRLISVLNPSAEQQSRIRELSGMSQATEDLLPQLDGLLGQAMQQRAASKQQEVLEKARAAVQKVGKRDGFTMVFESQVAVYGATDLTDEALKTMDADNP